MIRDDWRIALFALQVMAEQGPGMAYAQAEAAETAILNRSLKALGA